MRLIDADALLKKEKVIQVKEVGYTHRSIDPLDVIEAPTIEAEPTFEQIKEYCRKRCLIVIDSALFNEMKSRWSAEPRKHGKWPTTFSK